jgi:hypothetical protein
MASSVANVRKLSSEANAAVLAAFHALQDAGQDDGPRTWTGQTLCIADLQFALAGICESAAAIHRAIRRMENRRIRTIVMDSDCMDAVEALFNLATAITAALDETPATVGEFASVGGGFEAAPVHRRMTEEQYRDSQLFARRLGVDHRCDGPSVHRDLQGHVPQEIIDMVAPPDERGELLDIADADPAHLDGIEADAGQGDEAAWDDETTYTVSDPHDGPADDEAAVIPSPKVLANRIARMRAAKIANGEQRMKLHG